MEAHTNNILNLEFVLLDKLGQGAFGEVYLARDVALGVIRAIKILRRDAPGTGSTQFDLARQRVELEAQIGAQLEQHRRHLDRLGSRPDDHRDATRAHGVAIPA